MIGLSRIGLGLSLPNLGGGLASEVAAAVARTGGVWFDPSDAATVFQERSSPSTTAGNGDLVGTIHDKNGTNHGVPATDAQRATLTVSGGVTYLGFDGTNDSYIFSNSIAFGTASAVFLGIRRQVAGTNLARMVGDTVGGNFGFAWSANLDGFANNNFAEGNGRILFAKAGDTDWHVFGWTRDQGGNEATLRVDGAEVDSVTHAQASATATLVLGASGGAGTTSPMAADVTQMIVMEDLPTAEEIASIEAFITAKNGG